MKIIRRTALLLFVVVGGAAAWPAQAAGPYTIQGGLGGGAVATGAWLMNASSVAACNDAVVGHPGQGVDSYALNVSQWAGRFVHIDWSAQVDNGRLEVKWYKANCQAAIIAGQATSAENPGRWTTLVPSEAKWVVVAPALMANVSFSINPA